jgi:hypothetical protein
MPFISANLVPAATHITPVAIQMSSITSSELFLIFKRDYSLNFEDPSLVEMRI